jgi:hypothetical protein
MGSVSETERGRVMEVCQTVVYRGLMALVRNEDLKDGIEYFETCGRERRRATLKRVQSFIDKAADQHEKGTLDLSEQDRKDLATDIGIWFSYQVYTGKAEEHKVSMN